MPIHPIPPNATMLRPPQPKKKGAQAACELNDSLNSNEMLIEFEPPSLSSLQTIVIIFVVPKTRKTKQKQKQRLEERSLEVRRLQWLEEESMHLAIEREKKHFASIGE
jgi:hypothetical protein